MMILIASKTMLINRKILTISLHSFCANRTFSYYKLCKVNASFSTVLWRVWQWIRTLLICCYFRVSIVWGKKLLWQTFVFADSDFNGPLLKALVDTVLFDQLLMIPS